MRFHADCGLSFKVWWIFIVILDLLFSGVIAFLSGWIFCFQVGRNFQLIYPHNRIENYIAKNQRYEFIVTSWLLMVLFCLCTVRVFSSIVLVTGVRKSSAEVSRLWIAFKVFQIFFSCFIFTASCTVGIYVRLAALISVVGDLLTGYFIRVLYPELDKMRRFIVKIDDPEKTPPQ